MKPKDLILKYISEMDSEMLSMVLSDERTYQEATKAVFLEKLDEIFIEFKEKGETFLTPYKGKCGSEDCTNKGCTGYSFIGAESKGSLNLIFEESDDVVRDIYNCNMMISEYSEWESCQNQLLYISRDEEANFNPSPDYLIIVQLCQNAIDEISYSDTNNLFKEDYIYWLEKHKGLKARLKEIPIFFNKTGVFGDIYFKLSEMLLFLEYDTEALNGLEEFKSIDNSSQKEVIQFLLKYEKCIDELSTLLYMYLLEEEEPYRGSMEVDKKFKIYIAISDFENVLRFVNKFHPIYWDTVEEYVTQNKLDRSNAEINQLSKLIQLSKHSSI